ncbi:HNH endonuclease family protein [Longispora albida]|uniref:HNH endonuclease family protein n=1 Tax=Longispora albida TaxID=203523 RepID=UPI0003AB29CC|nr:HNH endonuclease family protein [Longispora albida]
MSPRILPLVAGVTLVLLGGCSTPPATGSPSRAEAATNQLSQLTVRPAGGMAGYSREKFPHWSAVANGCDTREFVLKREGTGIKTDKNCKVTAGRWRSPYDDKQHTAASDLDIDHMVPLANAWRSGANEWDNDRRGEFANDLDRPQLFAVTNSVNRAKGDQDPSQWKPPNRSYWCEYAVNWIAVKKHWALSVTSAERDALKDMLSACT